LRPTSSWRCQPRASGTSGATSAASQWLRVNGISTRPGPAIVRVRWSPYWRAHGGCVERAGEWTRVIARRTGRVRLTTTFSPERVVLRGRRCG
jgi:hypothetical protein